MDGFQYTAAGSATVTPDQAVPVKGAVMPLAYAPWGAAMAHRAQMAAIVCFTQRTRVTVRWMR